MLMKFVMVAQAAVSWFVYFGPLQMEERVHNWSFYNAIGWTIVAVYSILAFEDKRL